MTFVSKFGESRIPGHRDGEYAQLGRSVNEQRQAYSFGKISDGKIARLKILPGWAWNVLDTQWEEGFEALLAYVEKYGAARVPASHVEGDVKLGRWVTIQRRTYLEGSLPKERQERLKGVHASWAWSVRSAQFEEGIEVWQVFAREDHLNVPRECSVNGI